MKKSWIENFVNFEEVHGCEHACKDHMTSCTFLEGDVVKKLSSNSRVEAGWSFCKFTFDYRSLEYSIVKHKNCRTENDNKSYREKGKMQLTFTSDTLAPYIWDHAPWDDMFSFKSQKTDNSRARELGSYIPNMIVEYDDVTPKLQIDPDVGKEGRPPITRIVVDYNTLSYTDFGIGTDGNPVSLCSGSFSCWYGDLQIPTDMGTYENGYFQTIQK